MQILEIGCPQQILVALAHDTPWRRKFSRFTAFIVLKSLRLWILKKNEILQLNWKLHGGVRSDKNQ